MRNYGINRSERGNRNKKEGAINMKNKTNGEMATNFEEVKKLGKEMDQMLDETELAEEHKQSDPKQFTSAEHHIKHKKQ